MPVNKNAMTRYQILDDLLSNRYHDYSLNDLTNEVNKRLATMDISAVSRRCIELDIQYLEYESPFMVEIERYSVPAYSTEKQKNYSKRCLRYATPSYSIFKKALTSDEEYLLSEALSLLGQFDGLPDFEALDNLRKGLNVTNDRQIISFTKNLLEDSSLIGRLFTSISQKQVIEITYHRFGDTIEVHKITLHPYLLKEYNHRWFLFAASVEDEKLLCFALDRIDAATTLPSYEYVNCPIDINEYFDDIIGVTNYANEIVEHILFWVSDNSKDYVKTKPIHGSQKFYHGDKDSAFRIQYPSLSGGAFFSIDCKCNYELIRELCSFGCDLLVLSPKNIQDMVYERISEMMKEYGELRK
jgi:predicted DNA-binding transcriptional regulator YafY